ncbi:MAG: hypothetical protein SGPRY_013233 [Prymnesium sp.]
MSDSAILLDPTYGKAYLRRGELRERTSDLSSACDDFTSAARFDSGAVGKEASRRLAEARRARDAQNAQNARRGRGANGGGGRAASGAAKEAKPKCHYEVLSLVASATVEEVRKAYKKVRHGVGGRGEGELSLTPKQTILGRAGVRSELVVVRVVSQLALKHHPDKNNGSEEQRAAAQTAFLEVQKAYEILSDPGSRRATRGRGWRVRESR